MSIPLAVIEAIVDASGVAPAIEELLPRGVRARQLSIRTLLTGMMLALGRSSPGDPRGWPFTWLFGLRGAGC